MGRWNATGARDLLGIGKGYLEIIQHYSLLITSLLNIIKLEISTEFFERWRW